VTGFLDSLLGEREWVKRFVYLGTVHRNCSMAKEVVPISLLVESSPFGVLSVCPIIYFVVDKIPLITHSTS
jgi:hypothetical protein